MQYTLSISPDIRHCQTPQNPEWRLLWLPRHQNRAPLLRTNVALAPASEEKRSGQVSRTEWCCSWIKLNQIESDWVRLTGTGKKNGRTKEPKNPSVLCPFSQKRWYSITLQVRGNKTVFATEYRTDNLLSTETAKAANEANIWQYVVTQYVVTRIPSPFTWRDLGPLCLYREKMPAFRIRSTFESVKAAWSNLLASITLEKNADHDDGIEMYWILLLLHSGVLYNMSQQTAMRSVSVSERLQ